VRLRRPDPPYGATTGPRPEKSQHARNIDGVGFIPSERRLARGIGSADLSEARRVIRNAVDLEAKGVTSVLADD
jgi:hypothetical protein